MAAGPRSDRQYSRPRQAAVASAPDAVGMATNGHVIDAAVRFLRTNPELLAYARAAAPDTGMSVERILADAVRRLRESSAADAVAEKEVVA